MSLKHSQAGGLSVVVQTDHDVAPHLMEARHHRAVLAEVARQVHKHDGGVPLTQLADGVGGVVGAAVVDQDDLMVVLVRAGGERVVQLPDHRADGVGRAVAGNHKGKRGLP